MTTALSPHMIAVGGVPGAADAQYCPFMPTFGAPPVTFERGKGTELWDTSGKRYLDFLSGLAVTGLGHSHPEVTDAIALQAGILMHVSNLFATTVGPQVAMKIDRLLGGEIGRAHV